MVGKAWRHEMAGHIAPTVRNHGGMNFDAQLASFFFSSLGPQPMGWCLPHIQDGSSLSEASLETATGMPRGLSPKWF